jgi:hypothetical protein
MKRYMVLGGIKFTNRAGTISFSGMKELGKADSLDEVMEIVKNNEWDTAGLMCYIDLIEGKVENIKFSPTPTRTTSLRTS